MKYFSTFSGIGGFELGLQLAYDDLSTAEGQEQGRISQDSTNNEQFQLASQQPTCVGFSEIDKYATQIYLQHFPTHKNYGDITKIRTEELPDFELLVGGFPCQAFSIAGKRRGFEDTRGTMFFELARILQAKQPRLFIFENVKGLLSHNNGETFKTIISTLDELGYDLQWQVCNSKNFGVPQSRERVYIVGNLRGTARPKVFPIGGTNKKSLVYVGAVMSENNKKWLDNGKQQSRNFPQGQRIYSKEGTSVTLNALGGGLGAKTGLYAIPVLTPHRPTKRQNGRRFKENGDPSFTITSQDRHGVYDGVHVRKLTPKECERLQGFPDNWTESVSDSQRYKCLGNAVTVNVIRHISTSLLQTT